MGKKTEKRVNAALAYLNSSEHIAYKSQKMSQIKDDINIIDSLNIGFDRMKNGGSEQFMSTLCSD